MALATALLIIIGILYTSFGPAKPAAAADISVDSSVSTTDAFNDNDSATTVFTSDQVGYTFYRDATGSDACKYSKTTDGGASWGAGVTVDGGADCIKLALWYDRWTPGDNSGTIIHILTFDVPASCSPSCDLYYTQLDTASDTLTTNLNITDSSSANKTNTTGSGATTHTYITKGTDGSLWAALVDSGSGTDDAYVIKCASQCTTGSNWAGSLTLTSGNRDEPMLFPQSGGNILLVMLDAIADDIVSKLYTNGSGWAGSFTTIDAGASDNAGTASYDGQMGGFVDKSNYNVYISYPANDGTLGGNDDDVRTASYASATWTNKTDCITNSTKGLTNTKLAYDENTSTIYCIYTLQTTPAQNPGATDANIYYKTSTDGMTTWSSESAAVNATQGDIRGAQANLVSSDRLYVSWYTPSAISGQVLKNLSVTIDGDTRVSGTTYDSSAPDTVFTDDQTGYKFYRDNGGSCVYSKTTNGGRTWGSAVTADSFSGSNCIRIAVWYDKWTPGDTGTVIRMMSVDGSASNYDLIYNELNTSNDTFAAGTSINLTNASGVTKTNTFDNNGNNFPYVTKSTTGVTWTGIQDSGTAGDQSYFLKCSSSCTTVANWSEKTPTGLNDASSSAPAAANQDELLLFPLSSGDILAVVFDNGNDTLKSSAYTSGSDTWASFTNRDTSAADNTTYNGQISGFVDTFSGKVYISWVGLDSTLGTDDEVRTAIYDAGTWTNTTACLTGTSLGLTDTNLAYDYNTDSVYCIYTARSTAGTSSTGGIYWKVSTDGMSTWGSQHGQVNPIAGDLTGMSANFLSDERLFISWHDPDGANPNKIYGKLLLNLAPPTYVQSGYRLFSNADSTNVSGSPVAAQNTATSLTSIGAGNFRLRMLIKVLGDGARTSFATFKLQYAGKGAGTCASPSGTPSSYTDVPIYSSTANDLFRFYDNPTPSDGAAVTGTGDLTNDNDSIVLQTYEDQNNSYTIGSALLGGNDGKWDFSLKDVFTAPPGTSYCFRIVKSSGTALSGYEQYAEIVTAVPSVSEQMRGGVWFSQNAKRPHTWAE